jgi:hypothetical protein
MGAIATEPAAVDGDAPTGDAIANPQGAHNGGDGEGNADDGQPEQEVANQVA